MFIWTPDSELVGIIHFDAWGNMLGNKVFDRAGARAIYTNLRRRGRKLTKEAGCNNLRAYVPVIDQILKTIK